MAQPEESQVGNGCPTVCRSDTATVSYGNTTDLLRIFYDYVAVLSQYLAL